jgi:hypothetical protein
MQNNNREKIKEASDLELAQTLKERPCGDTLLELCKRHGAIYSAIIAKLSQKYGNWFITNELLKDKELVVYNSALKYDPNKKTKLSTFIGNEAKWHYLNKCNQQKRLQQQASIPDELLIVSAIEESHEATISKNDTLKYVFKSLSRHPDTRIAKIFKLRYEVGKENKVMPWHLVGKEVGLSAQGCINIHKTGIKFLQEKLKKEGTTTSC